MWAVNQITSEWLLRHEVLQLNFQALGCAVHGNNPGISCFEEDPAQAVFEYLWGGAALHCWIITKSRILAGAVSFPCALYWPVNGSQAHLQNPQQPTRGWSAFNWDFWRDPSPQTGVSPAWAAQAWVSACLFVLVTDRKGTFLPFRDEVFLSWDRQGYGAAEVWKNPLQVQAFGNRFLEWPQLCRTGLMLCIWKDFKGKMVKWHICLSRWSVQHCFPRCCHFYFVVL